MELILFIGVQATGKSCFYRHAFFRTHLRINLDMLRTRHREKLLTDACIAGKTKFVVDNTNLIRDDRARYIQPAKEAGFRIVGYFFESRINDAIRRNAARADDERVPDMAIHSASKNCRFRRSPRDLMNYFLFTLRKKTNSKSKNGNHEI